ncbi:hypothetical protein NQ317_004966 [Molorchus minor]|uniref:Dynein axonemal intermediate chain 4 n=1 Tax=Molorchus minor TaxID=1323400 RepID=A0ABQ9K316_9CUCU|nr:hypothetical protein NQ317_004966 [Molorchus minor]
MFGVKHNECVGFESRWKVKKVSSETSTQTTEFSASEKGTSTLNTTSTQMQTVSDEKIVSQPEVDMQKLADWLSKIYPKVKNEIDEANNSHAFRGYKLAEELTEANCKLLQTINILKVSQLSWNQTGKSIAVSCGYGHKTWCYHSGTILIYTLNKDERFPETPRKKLSTETCVMSMKFHPQHPAILAAGTFSGAIVVWNIQSDEEDTINGVAAHEQPVTQISWIIDVDAAKTVILASSSTDGLLKLWNFDPSTGSLTVKSRRVAFTLYKIKVPLFSAIKQRELEGETAFSKGDSRGIICFDFSRHVPDLFVVGAEGGLVVQCSVLGTSTLKGSTKDEPLLDPVYKYYEPHEGELTHISISPNRKDMFMTYGTDCEVRVYLFGQEEPAQILCTRNPLSCVDFVPREERLLVGGGRIGIPEIFELTKGKPLRNVTAEKVRRQLLTVFVVNQAKNNFVAFGTANGDLQLWNIPWSAFVRNL